MHYSKFHLSFEIHKCRFNDLLCCLYTGKFKNTMISIMYIIAIEKYLWKQDHIDSLSWEKNHGLSCSKRYHYIQFKQYKVSGNPLLSNTFIYKESKEIVRNLSCVFTDITFPRSPEPTKVLYECECSAPYWTYVVQICTKREISLRYIQILSRLNEAFKLSRCRNKRVEGEPNLT